MYITKCYEKDLCINEQINSIKLAYVKEILYAPMYWELIRIWSGEWLQSNQKYKAIDPQRLLFNQKND
jgi:hypothetical protein